MVVEARVSAIASTLTNNRGVNMNAELQNNRQNEIDEMLTETGKKEMAIQHEYEDKVSNAISTVWNSAINLEAHGFIDYDATYLVFALEKFKKEFEYANERDRKRWE